MRTTATTIAKKNYTNLKYLEWLRRVQEDKHLHLK